MKYIQFLACVMSTFAVASEIDARKCQDQGEPLTCYSPAYNAPAIISVNPKERKAGSPNINLFVDASFTYWWAGEDGLTLAERTVIDPTTGVIYSTPKTSVLTQSFSYQPGFKIGTGVVGYQEWTVFGEYTWFRGKTHKESGPLSGTSPTATRLLGDAATSGNNVWSVDGWFLQVTDEGKPLSGPAISSSWDLDLDLIDLLAGRPFYQGRHLSISPFGGLRSALIRQSINLKLTESPDTTGTLTPQPIESRNHSNSWSIGPMGGCEVKCLFPMGFRLEGDFAASLLYTRYTSIKHSEDVAFTDYGPGPYTASSKYTCVRPIAEAGLGIGWGSYLCHHDYHIDCFAGYDFKIFWAQNMIRQLLADRSSSAGDLFLHGLTVTARFDF